MDKKKTVKELRKEKAEALAQTARARFLAFHYEYEVSVKGDKVLIEAVAEDLKDHQWLDRQMAGMGAEKADEKITKRDSYDPENNYTSTHIYTVA